MFKVERALSGLLGSFKLFSQGSLPRNMLEEIRPCVDLHTYALQSIGMKVYASAAVAVGPGTLITFVQPKDWLVMGTDVVYTAGAAGEYTIASLDFASEGAYSSAHSMCSQIRYNTAATLNSIAAGEQRRAAVWPNSGTGPLWAKAGSIWYLNNSANSIGATGTLLFSILYYEIQNYS